MTENSTISEILTWARKQKTSTLQDAFVKRNLINMLNGMNDLNNQKNGDFYLVYIPAKSYKKYIDAVNGGDGKGKT